MINQNTTPRTRRRVSMKQMSVGQKIKTLTVPQRLNKAIRHLYDALYYRSPNNELDYIDDSIIKIIWLVANSQQWNTWIWLLFVTYQVFTFFEPTNHYSQQQNKYLFIMDGIVLFFLIIDYIFILTYNYFLYSYDGQTCKKMFKSKNAFKLLIIVAFLVDFLIAFINFPDPSLRFTRILRAIAMCLYSKDLRRNMLGIVKSIKNLLLLFIFYFIIIAFYAFIGINLIGANMNGVHQEIMDYGDFIKLFNMLYMLSTMDFYPDIMMPSYKENSYYLLYFIPYILLFIFLFIPIPLAVVYEGFRKFRMEILIDDRIKQKTALLTSFMCLDFENKGYIPKKQFIYFIKSLYKNHLSLEDINELCERLDKNKSQRISIEEFFQLGEIIEQSEKFYVDKIYPPKWWTRFREYCNQKVNLKQFVDGTIMTMIMLIVTLINCSIIIAAFFIEDEEILFIFDIIDKICFGVYCLEMIIKFIALGIVDYFKDDWNKFDFVLIVFQIIFDFVLYNVISEAVVSSFKANRIVKLAKIQKIFRLFRAFRTIKIMSYLIEGLQIFNDVKNLFYKILICVPAVMKLASIVWIVFYIYATVGVEVFSNPIIKESPYLAYDCLDDPNQTVYFLYNHSIYLKIYQWGDCNYTDFSTFTGAFLLLLQTFMTSQWSLIVFDIAYKEQNLLGISIFIGSFVFLSIFILALIGGLIWEVFIIVDKSVKQEELLEEEKEEQEEQQIQEQKIFKRGSIERRKAILKAQSSFEMSPFKKRKKTYLRNSIQYDDMSLILAGKNKIFNYQKSKQSTNMVNSEIMRKPHIVSQYIKQKTIQNENSVDRRDNDQEIQELKVDQEEYSYNIIKEMYQSNFLNLNRYRTQKKIAIAEFESEMIKQICEDLKNLESFQEMKVQNHNALIANAILQNANQEEIKQKEFNHFFKLFGEDFDRLREIQLTKLLDIQSRILFDLSQIVKFQMIETKLFLQIIHALELKISQSLLKSNSYFKLIHQLNNGVWFTIVVVNEQVKFKIIQEGPWNYLEEIVDNNSEINGNLTIANELPFQVNASEEFKETSKFHKSLIELSNEFMELNQESLYKEQYRLALMKVQNAQYKKSSESVIKTVLLCLIKHTSNEISQEDNKYSYLPFSFVLEMMIDFARILYSNNSNYFSKLNEIFLSKTNS